MAEIKSLSRLPGAVSQRGPIFTEAVWRFFRDGKVQYDLRSCATGNTEENEGE